MVTVYLLIYTLIYFILLIYFFKITYAEQQQAVSDTDIGLYFEILN